MSSIDIRSLGNTHRFKALLRAGVPIEMRDHGRIVARILPQIRPKPPVTRGRLPDFSQVRKEILGDRIVPGADLLIRERGRW